MCSNSPSLIVSLHTGSVVLGLGKESQNPSSPFWGAPAQVSWVTCDLSEQGFCRKVLCSPKHLWARSPAAWKCKVLPLGSPQAPGQACPGSSHPGDGRTGAPLCGSPQFWGECQPRSRVCREKALSSRNSADWLLCYYPETGPGAERGCS